MIFYIHLLGTPGTGKTTLAQEISTGNQLNFISVSDYAKENDLVSGYDETLQCPILDEDQLIGKFCCSSKELYIMNT